MCGQWGEKEQGGLRRRRAASGDKLAQELGLLGLKTRTRSCIGRQVPGGRGRNTLLYRATPRETQHGVASPTETAVQKADTDDSENGMRRRKDNLFK